MPSENRNRLRFEELTETFALLPDEDERLHFLIDLGRRLPPLSEEEKCESNLVRGCVSSVWLIFPPANVEEEGMRIRGGSDSLIVSGLVSLLLARYDGATPEEILATDASTLLAPLRLEGHLSPGRRNGLAAMMERVGAQARRVLEG